jgi:lysophospholipase L1-like esterase
MSPWARPGQRVREMDWSFVLRLLAKAALLFALFNIVFALLQPMETLGRLSLYNGLLPGRPRLPYGENPSDSYNLSLNNVPAMMASHVISRDKAEDEFRVLLLGDSGTWGWLLDNDQTLAGQLNAAGLRTDDGRRVVVYNLGYPIMSLTKDLLLLDEAMAYEPDLVLWPVTLQSFDRQAQLDHPLLQNNAERVRRLIAAYDLDLDPADARFVEPDFWGRTIAGQRRPLADLLRLQLYGFSWAATGIDQARPAEVQLRESDFEADLSWQDYEEPVALGPEALAYDVLVAGRDRAAELPLLLVNEPIFISQGQNSDLRYNAWYPRWAYDQYRAQLSERAQVAGWDYLDLWDSVEPQEFTDSPVHLTPAGTQELAALLAPSILELANGR